MRRLPAILAVLSVLALASVAAAAPVLPTSYAMPNGYTAAYNYWDQIYSGSGSVTTDGAPLSGGLGDLTDGIIATDNWFVAEAPAGDGLVRRLDDYPVITFNFAPGTTVDAMTIQLTIPTVRVACLRPGGSASTGARQSGWWTRRPRSRSRSPSPG